MTDNNSNGVLSFSEMKNIMETVDLDSTNQYEFFMQVDSDGSGQIDFSEFCEMIILIGHHETGKEVPKTKRRDVDIMALDTMFQDFISFFESFNVFCNLFKKKAAGSFSSHRKKASSAPQKATDNRIIPDSEIDSSDKLNNMSPFSVKDKKGFVESSSSSTLEMKTSTLTEDS